MKASLLTCRSISCACARCRRDRDRCGRRAACEIPIPWPVENSGIDRRSWCCRFVRPVRKRTGSVRGNRPESPRLSQGWGRMPVSSGFNGVGLLLETEQYPGVICFCQGQGPAGLRPSWPSAFRRPVFAPTPCSIESTRSPVCHGSGMPRLSS